MADKGYMTMQRRSGTNAVAFGDTTWGDFGKSPFA